MAFATYAYFFTELEFYCKTHIMSDKKTTCDQISEKLACIHVKSETRSKSSDFTLLVLKWEQSLPNTLLVFVMPQQNKIQHVEKHCQ